MYCIWSEMSVSLSVTLSHLMNNPNSEWTLSTLTICTFLTQKHIRSLTLLPYSLYWSNKIFNWKTTNLLLYLHNLYDTITASKATDKCSHILWVWFTNVYFYLTLIPGIFVSFSCLVTYTHYTTTIHIIKLKYGAVYQCLCITIHYLQHVYMSQSLYTVLRSLSLKSH